MSEYDLNNQQKKYRTTLEKASYLKSEDTRLINILKGTSSIQMNSLPELDQNDLTYVYFTRPNLNLNAISLSRNRKLLEYANKDDSSVQKYIRGSLSPIECDKNNLKSNVLDNKTPFIPLLSNTLETLTGWPDEILESWVSESGLMGEKWGHVNSTIIFHDTFELEATFINVKEDPVAKLFNLWETYSSEVRYGNIIPWIGSIANRETDYFTAIYVIVTNSRHKIKHIARTFGYPIANPKGIFFDFSRNEIKTGKFDIFSTRFKCFGAEYDDPALLFEFNESMMAFNTEIRNTLVGKSEDIVEVPSNFREMFQNEGYPLIDLEHNTLEYVISKDKYKVEKRPIIEEELNLWN